MPEAAAAFIFKKAAAFALKAGASKALAVKIAGATVFVAKTGLTLAASYAINRALAPDIARPDNRNPIRQPTPRRKQGFGRNRATGAYLLYGATDGDSIDVLAIADHLIAGIDQYWLHDDVVTLGSGNLGSGHVLGNSSTEEYFDAIYIDTRLGAPNQTAFTRARSRLPAAWKASSTMTGVAGLELLCLGPKKERLPKVYPLGLPRPGVTYRGQYCFDWRAAGQNADTWTGWTPGSANPVLQLATKMINPADPDPSDPSRALGWGFDWGTDIAPRLADWTAAADACGAGVPRKGGGTEARYECHFEHHNDEAPADTLETLLASFDGWISETGDGALTVKAGQRAAGDEVALDQSLILDFQMNRGRPREALKNVFLAFWTDPARKFSRVEAEPWFDAGSIALTGVRETAQVGLEQCQSHGQVRRLLKRIALRENAEAFGVMTLDLLGLDYMGERWLRVPEDFADSAFLRGKLLEVRDFRMDLSGAGRVVIDWVLYDEDADDWDPDSEEGTAPPGPEDLAPSVPPVIDAGDIAAAVETGARFGGVREAYAVLTFPAPVRSFDLAGAGVVDVPRTDLSWVVRWRPQTGGAWTEAEIRGDVVTGDAQSGYDIRLETPALPRAALHVQVAAIGPRDDRGDWSDSVPVDVAAATAPPLAAPQNVTATAALQESAGGVRRPALTVAFDPITDPQAQLVIIAVKATDAADSEYAQIDAVEPRLGGKTTFNIPYGVNRDVGLQVWSQWREPSAWATVDDVEIPGELVARDATLPSERITAVRDAIDGALRAASEDAAEAAGRLAAVADTGAPLSLKTWLRDPLFTGTEGWRTAGGGVIQLVAGDPNALQAYWPFDAIGEAAAQYLIWPVDQRISPARFVQAACDVGVVGSVSEVILYAVWLNEAGGVLSQTEIARGSSGRIAGVVEAPADTYAVHLRCVPVTGEAAGGAFFIRRPQAAYALPGQTDVDAFAAPGDELIARIETLERILGGITEFRRNQISENENAYSRLSTLIRTVASEDLALAERIDQLEVSFGFELDGLQQSVATRATITFVNQVGADAESARALIQQDLTALTNNLSDNYLTGAQIGATYLAQSNLQGALATIDWNAVAFFNNLEAKVNVNIGALVDINGRLAASFGFTVDADGNIAEMVALADNEGSLIAFRSDTFLIYDGTSQVPVFSVSGGQIALNGNVAVNGSLIVNGTVTASEIQGGAVTDGIGANAGSVSLNASGGYSQVISVGYDSDGGVINLAATLTVAVPSTETGLEIRLMRNGVQVGVTANAKPASNFSSDVQVNRRITGVPAGLSTWRVDVRASNTQGGISGVSVNQSILNILETKR